MKQKENTLIFLDEIQVYPQQLRFLAQVGKFTYIASGSLLGVTLSETSSIPMGSIRKVRMFPLDYMDLFQKYLLVGGLPDAVNSYLENHNIQLVREILQEIHDYYAADALKYEAEKKLKIRRIYDIMFLRNRQDGDNLRF